MTPSLRRDPQPTDPNPEIPPAPHPAGNEPLRRYRRKQRRLLVLKIVLLLLALALGGVFYLQSAHGLRHVIMPRVAAALGTTIDYSGGDLSYGGVLQLSNLALEGSDGRPAFSARELYVRIDPRLLLGGQLVVREARLDEAQARYAVDRTGRTNWDFLAAGNQTSSTSQQQERIKSFPVIHVDQLAINGMELAYDDGHGLAYYVAPVNLNAKGLARGEQGQIQLTLQGEGRQAESDLAQHLQLKFDGTLRQGPAGELLGWAGKLTSEVRQTQPNAAGTTETQQVKLAGDTSGTLEISGKAMATANFNAATPQGAVGDLRAAVAWDPATGRREVDFDLRNVGPDALNPIMVAAGPLQLKSAALAGKGQVRGKGDQLEFSLDLTGRNLSFRRGKGVPTQAMELAVQQTGSYDLKGNRLRIATLGAGITQQGRPLIEAKLNQPAELDLGGGAQALNQAGAQLALSINDVSWNDLKPWVMLLGGPEDLFVTSGKLAGKVTLDLTRGGRSLALAGNLTADNLQLAALATPPLRLNPKFSGSLVDFKAVKFDHSSVDLIVGGAALASLSAEGQYQLDKGTAELRLQMQSDQLTNLIDTLNGAAPPPANVSGGRFTASQQVTLDSVHKQVALTGQISLSDLNLRMNTGSTPLGAQGKVSLTIDQGRQRLEIGQSELNITGAGAAEPGLVGLTGSWPLGAVNQTGTLKLNLKRIDAAPWLALAGLLQADALPRLPLEADEEITLTGDKLNIKGDARIGLPPGAGAATASQPQTVEVHHALQRAGAVFQQILLDLNATDNSNTLSNVHLEGTGRTAPATRFDLSAKVGTLDLDALLARIDAILGNKPSAGEAGTAKGESTGKPKPERPDSILDAKLDVARLIYRNQDLRDAKARARFENGTWTINIDQSQLNGGPFSGQFSYDGYRTDPRMAWDLKTERSPIEKLVAIGSPEAAKKISGLGNINTRGSAEGTGEKFKQSLQGNTQFSIADGELRENRFLDALADQTAIGSFRNVKFFDFSGGLNMANNRINFNECLLKGPTHRIDVKGHVGLDGKYEITLIPAVVSAMADRIPGQNFVSNFARDATGFLQFPFGVTIRGEPGKYIVLPRVGLPVNPGGTVGKVTEGITEGINQGVGFAAEGVKDTVGGVFRATGKGLSTLTGGGKDKAATNTTATTDSATSTEPTPAAPKSSDGSTTPSKSMIGKTGEKLGEATEKTKDAVGGVFRGMKKIIK
jgi:hypothetical protein